MLSTRKFRLALGFAVLAVVGTAQAEPFTIDFEGVADLASINGFYNGGTDSEGNSGGAAKNFGVQFSEEALALTESGPTSNIGNMRAPGETGMVFLQPGSSAILNYGAGFDAGFSFWYTTVAFTGVVTVWDGLDATGSILATINLAALGAGADPANPFSNWDIGSAAFQGIAKSIDFGGTANQVVYDNITFGSTNPTIPPNGVPEPTSLALVGAALLAAAAARRRRI